MDVREIAGSNRVVVTHVGVADAFAEANATAPMACGAAGELTQTPRGLLKRRDDERASVHGRSGKGIWDADLAKVTGLEEHRARMQRKGRPEQGSYARHEGSGSELRKRVVPSVRGDDVVSGLGAPVEAHDQPGVSVADQKVGDRALSGVAEAEIDDDPGLAGRQR